MMEKMTADDQIIIKDFDSEYRSLWDNRLIFAIAPEPDSKMTSVYVLM